MLNITFILALMNNKTLYFIKNLVNITNKNIPTAKKYNLYYDNIHEIRKEMYEGGKFILIQLNKNIIGYVKYTIKNKNCYLNSFSIHPYYFSKQIENIVFNFLNDVAVNYNCDKILIEIPFEMDKFITYYKQYGFTEVDYASIIKTKYNNTKITIITIEKNVKKENDILDINDIMLEF